MWGRRTGFGALSLVRVSHLPDPIAAPTRDADGLSKSTSGLAHHQVRGSFEFAPPKRVALGLRKRKCSEPKPACVCLWFNLPGGAPVAFACRATRYRGCSVPSRVSWRAAPFPIVASRRGGVRLAARGLQQAAIKDEMIGSSLLRVVFTQNAT